MDAQSGEDLRIQMLLEYLSAEGGAQEDGLHQISRLIIAGNSLAPAAATADTKATIVETNSRSVSDRGVDSLCL